jgi:hypothetical protein
LAQAQAVVDSAALLSSHWISTDRREHSEVGAG